MSGIKSFFSKLPVQVFLFSVVSIYIFLILPRPVENIYDIEVADGYAYLSYGEHGIVALDISDKENIVEVGDFDTFGSARGLALRENDLYVADGSNGLVVLDVSDPANIKQKWHVKELKDAWDIAFYRDFAYIVDGVKGLYSLEINPFPSKDNGQHVWHNEDAEQGLTRILIDGGKVYTVGIDNNLHFFNIPDGKPAKPNKTTTVTTGAIIKDFVLWESNLYFVADEMGLAWIKNPGADTEAPNGNYPIEGGVSSLEIYGDFAFVGIPNRGVVVYDISNLEHITKISSNDDIKQPTKLIYHDAGLKDDGYLYVGDGEKGFKTVRIEYDAKIPGDAKGEVLGSVEDIAVYEKYIYIASCEQGIQVAEFREEKDVIKRGDYKELPGCAVSVAVTKDFLLAAHQEKGLRVYSLDLVLSPKQINDIDTPGSANDVVIKGEYAYIADGESGLQVIDWDGIIKEIQLFGYADLDIDDDDKVADAQGIFILNDYAYVAVGDEGLAIVNISDPGNPELVSTHEVGFFARAVFVYDFPLDDKDRYYAYVVGGEDDDVSGLQVIDVTAPASPQDFGPFRDNPEPLVDVFVEGLYLYLLQESKGLSLLSIKAPDSLQEIELGEQDGEYSKLTFHDKYIFIGRKRDGFRAIRFEDGGEIAHEFEFSGGWSVNDLDLTGFYAYAADGEKGLRIINLEDPKDPSIVKNFPSIGEIYGITIQNNLAYLASGNKGLEILNIENRETPIQVGVYEELKNALDVEVKGKYAYIANGEDGITILDIETLSEIKVATEFKEIGSAKDVAIVGEYAFIATGGSGMQVVRIVNPKNPRDLTTDFDLSDSRAITPSQYQEHLFIADGSDGAKVFDISTLAEPTIIFDFEGEKNYNSSDVSIMERYFAVADGENGALIFYYPGEYHIPSWVDTERIGKDGINVNKVNIVDLSPDSPSDFHIVISDEEGGVKVRTIEKRVGTTFEGFYEAPGNATFKEVFSALKSVVKSTYASLLDQAGSVTLLNLPKTLIGTSLEQWRTYIVGRVKTMISMIVFAVIFLGVTNFIGLVLVSGLILPIRTFSSIREVYRRLSAFMFGQHGPVVFAEDGKQIERDGIRDVGLGFAKVDACSAVVIERTAYQPGCIRGLFLALLGRHPREKLRSRTEDVGIQFTRTGERVRGVADLRKQIRLRPGVKAHTRDGIEVNTVVFALYTLGEPPEVYKVTYVGEEKPENLRVVETKLRDPGEEDGQYQIQVVDRLVDILDPEDKLDIHRFVRSYSRRAGLELTETIDEPNGWRPFRFYPQRVFAAIASRPFDVFKGKRIDWTEIPAHLAVNTFRELLAQELYDGLFEPDDAQSYPLLDLKNLVRTRMVNKGILAYQFIKRADGKQIESDQALRESEVIQYPEQEFKARKELRSRGIKVITASFTELQPSISDVQSRYMFDHWRAPWQQEAVIIRSDHELQAVRMQNQARAQAQRDMAYTLSKILSASEFSREAMALRVFQALETAAADPATQSLLPRDTIDLMRSLRNMLLPGDRSFFRE